MKLYCVIDILLEEDETCEYDKYEEVFHMIAVQCSEFLISSVTRLESDQWQMVLRDAENAYEICLQIERLLRSYPVKAYYGIGAGTISTEIAEDTRIMDGQAFIMARESLETAKENRTNYSKVIPTRNCRIYFRCSQEETSLQQDLVNLMIQNNETLRSKITAKQRESIDLYEKYGSYIKLIEAHPEIKKGTLSDKMNKSSYWMIQSNQETIKHLLQPIHSME